VIITGGALYAIFISFSEHWEYTRKSLDYYILTPPEIAQMSELCIQTPGFIYSSADGPKPTIVQMNCTISPEDAEKYLESKDLLSKGNGVYINEEIEVQLNMNQDGEDVTSVVILVNISNSVDT
jgi:hypothetical protein